MILFGRSRIGHDVLKAFDKLKNDQNIKPLVIDYNPQTIEDLSRDGYYCKYGDVGDVELFQEINMKNVKIIVTTIPDLETNLLLIEEVRKHNKKAVIIVISHQIDDALDLYRAGATYVPLPHLLSGKHVATMIKRHGLKVDGFSKVGQKHEQDLKRRV